MKNKFEKITMNNIDSKYTNLKRNKEMFDMKKLLTIAISTIMIGALLTGCGKKVTTIPTTLDTTPKSAQATTEEKNTAPQTDKDGNKFTTSEQQAVADIAKAKPAIDKIVNTTIDLFYNVNATNVEANQKKVNDMAIDGAKPFGDDGVKFVKGGIEEKLVDFTAVNVEFKDNIKQTTTDKTVYGAVATTVVSYKENGVSKRDNVSLTIVFDTKNNAWKLTGGTMTEQK